MIRKPDENQGGKKIEGCAPFEAKDARGRGDLKKGLDLRDGLGVELMRFGDTSHVRWKDKGGFWESGLGSRGKGSLTGKAMRKGKR